MHYASWHTGSEASTGLFPREGRGKEEGVGGYELQSKKKSRTIKPLEHKDTYTNPPLLMRVAATRGPIIPTIWVIDMAVDTIVARWLDTSFVSEAVRITFALGKRP